MSRMTRSHRDYVVDYDYNYGHDGCCGEGEGEGEGGGSLTGSGHDLLLAGPWPQEGP